MRLAVLVLAIVCASTRADAERRNPPSLGWECSCTDYVRPRIDESGVPTNARLWRLPSLDRPDEALHLEPNTPYAFELTSFTTDAAEDHEAPAAPQNTRVWLAKERGLPRAQL